MTEAVDYGLDAVAGAAPPPRSSARSRALLRAGALSRTLPSTLRRFRDAILTLAAAATILACTFGVGPFVPRSVGEGTLSASLAR